MNDDDYKTVIQTEEDRRKLEKKLLGESSGDDTPVDTDADNQADSSDRQ